ncbi:MAG TPA: hypothetical protein VI136_07865 [Verrucomicrobiae bacterium]
MAIQIKSLARNTLPGSEGDLYAVPSGKAAIVKGMRLVNTGNSIAIVNLWFRRGTSVAGTTYRIVPKDLTLPPGGAFIDDSELTMEYVDSNNVDRIRGALTSGGPVDYVLSGVERDVS